MEIKITRDEVSISKETFSLITSCLEGQKEITSNTWRDIVLGKKDSEKYKKLLQENIDACLIACKSYLR